jgi:hypothetical protein
MPPATTSAAPPATWVPLGKEIDLTSHLAADGRLTWTVPAGDWTILRIGHTTTGAENEPAIPAGRGLECDKLSAHALDIHFAGLVQKVLDDSGPLAGKTLNNILIDSYEVGNQNWTPAFREEFRKRRGYDLLPYLPVLSGRIMDNPAVSERFLWDFRRTITDLFTENYYGHFAELCHARGLMFSTEAYGNGPFDELADGGRADIPMAEFWVGGAAVETVKMAASTGHIYGRPIIGAESFTAEPSHARWTNDPYALKAEGDQMYCGGINRFIFHRYAMQPWTDRAPGMTMGPWGIHFERTNTWWNQGAAWMTYLSRCQFLLQQGTFVADAAYFCGENDPVGMRVGNPPLPTGYDYDGLSRELLLGAMTVRDGRLTLPSGMSYRVLVLPPGDTMTPEVLRKLRQLVRDGATVVGPRPVRSPSLAGYPQADTEVAALANELWGGEGKTSGEHRLGKGRMVWGVPLAQVLAEQKVIPDFISGARSNGITYIHRSEPGAEIYFVASRRTVAQKVACSFRVSGRIPEIWHPDSGRTEIAPTYSEANGRTTVTLSLDPAGSAFVVFRKPSRGVDHAVAITQSGVSPAAAVAAVVIDKATYAAVDGVGGSADVTDIIRSQLQDGGLTFQATNAELGGDPAVNSLKQLVIHYTLGGKPGTLTTPENGVAEISDPTAGSRLPSFEIRRAGSGDEIEAFRPATYSVAMASGKTQNVRVDAVPAAVVVDGAWDIAFPPHLGAPASVMLPELASWSLNSDSGVRYFSGTATYSRNLPVPANLLGAGKALYLDLGEVKNIAEVTLNGTRLGILWKPPFRVNISGAARAGDNRLEVAVTNLWPNRLIGDEQLPDDAVWTDGHLAAWPQWLLDGKPSPTGRIAFATWKHWHKNDPLLPSGLLGPVRLLPSVIAKVP